MGKKATKKPPKDEDEPKEKPMGVLKVMTGLFKHAQLDKKSFIIIIVLSIAGSIIGLISPAIIQSIVDIVSSDRDAELILPLLAQLIIFAVCEYVISMVNNYSLQKLGINTIYSIRKKMFHHLQKLSFGYYHLNKTGKIISYLTNDVDTINTMISTGLINLIVQSFQLVGALVMMFVTSIHMSSILFVMIPLNLFLMKFFSSKSRKYWDQIRKAVTKVTIQAQENVSGFRTIKSFKTESMMKGKFDELARDEADKKQMAAKIWSGTWATWNIVGFVVHIGGSMLLGGILYLNGFPVTVGTISAFILYIMMFSNPLGTVATFFNEIQNSAVGGSRILRLLNTMPDLEERDDPITLENPEGHLQFENMHFSYGEVEVIKDINLEILPKERLAIVGPTGAGKTTLISLIPRFYDVKKGNVKIDGIDVRDFTFNSLRKNIGLVLQDNFLFAETIMENIRYGRLDATDEEVIEASKRAGAHEFIMLLTKGYQTRVGERGAILSIGQKQLIAFARTLLTNPPILILDEATSSVDAYSEILIQKALDKLLSNRTSIIIAHRLSTVVNSDRIIVIDDGKIIQQGSHSELMKEDGMYKRLYEMQFAESRINNNVN